MHDNRQPWFKFNPNNWQSDIALGQCSLAARGLWIELLAIMHKSDQRGFLLTSGQKPSTKTLAFLCRTEQRIVAKLLQELRINLVFSETEDGVIFSRKMVEDERKSLTYSENGKEGGSPLLTGKPPKQLKQKKTPRARAFLESKIDSIDSSLSVHQLKDIDSVPNATHSGAASAAPLPRKTPKDELWEIGLPIVQALTGRSETPARAFLGKLAKAAEDDHAAVLAAILRARDEQPINPGAWIMAAVTAPKRHVASEASKRVAVEEAIKKRLDAGSESHKNAIQTDFPTIDGTAEILDQDA